MEKYRIKIEELKNGEIWYSPQVLRGFWDSHDMLGRETYNKLSTYFILLLIYLIK